MKETVKFLQSSLPATITINLDIQSESGLISGEPVQIQQILTNLSTNALYFPKVAEKEPLAGAADEEPIPMGSERILFVDDEEPLVMIGEAILAQLGYEVTCRTNSREALELLKQDASRFDMVITDQTMPGITGLELAKELLAVRPELPVILCTGFSHLVDADYAKAAGIRAFATKPLTKGEIARTVRKVLDG